LQAQARKNVLVSAKRFVSNSTGNENSTAWLRSAFGYRYRLHRSRGFHADATASAVTFT
jgi:hypothetical protein